MTDIILLVQLRAALVGTTVFVRADCELCICDVWLEDKRYTSATSGLTWYTSSAMSQEFCLQLCEDHETGVECTAAYIDPSEPTRCYIIQWDGGEAVDAPGFSTVARCLDLDIDCPVGEVPQGCGCVPKVCPEFWQILVGDDCVALDPATAQYPIECTETGKGGSFDAAPPDAPDGGWCSDPLIANAVAYNNAARANGDAPPEASVHGPSQYDPTFPWKNYVKCDSPITGDRASDTCSAALNPGNSNAGTPNYAACDGSSVLDQGYYCLYYQGAADPLVCDETAAAQAVWWAQQMCTCAP